jgi:F-type H+-transporting ATPase subunit a
VSTSVVLASECPPEESGFCSPTVLEFFPKPLVEFDLIGVHFAITRITILMLIATVAVGLFFVASVRRPQMVPQKLQWMGESGYSFVRDGIAREVIGREGLRFAPYLAVLFFFILANNLMGIIPFAQIAPTSKIAIPAFLAAITYVLFNWVGIRSQGIVP